MGFLSTDRFSLSILFALLLMPSLLWGDSWYSLMRKGDEHMAAGRWDRATKYYLGALDAAGNSATGQLWQKYNKAYSRSLVQNVRESEDAQLSRHKVVKRAAPVKSGKSTAEATDKSDNDNSEDESVGISAETTATAYVEILPDGTVRMSLSDYMRDSRLSGYRPPAPKIKETESSSLAKSAAGSAGSSANDTVSVGKDKGTAEDGTVFKKSYWGQPVTDSTGDRKSFGSSEKVGLSGVLSEATIDNDVVGEVEIATRNYIVSDIKMKFTGARKLQVTGRVTNKSKSPVHNARVYVRLYNETGVFKGRKWGYLKPGRQSLAPRKTKKFKIEFGGYTGTVGSYKIEVVADFKR